MGGGGKQRRYRRHHRHDPSRTQIMDERMEGKGSEEDGRIEKNNNNEKKREKNKTKFHAASSTDQGRTHGEKKSPD